MITETPAAATSADTCRFGARCRLRTHHGPAATDGRGICPGCENHARQAIGELPALHEGLLWEIGKDAGRNVGGQDGGKRTEAPIPLRLHHDGLAREIVWQLQVWAAPVADLVLHGARADVDASRWPPDRAARLLLAHFPVLRSLPTTAYMPYQPDDTDLQPVEADGPDAIVGLADLHHRAQAALGTSPRLIHRDMPCPAPTGEQGRGGCGQDGTLVTAHGEDTVWCRACGWWCTTDEYTAYAYSFIAPEQRSRLVRL